MKKRLVILGILLALLAFLAPTGLAKENVSWIHHGGFGFVLPDGYSLFEQGDPIDEALVAKYDEIDRNSDALILNEDGSIYIELDYLSSDGNENSLYRTSYEAWASQYLDSTEGTETAVLTVGDITFWAISADIDGKGRGSVLQTDGSCSEGLCMRIYQAADADTRPLETNLLGITRDGKTHRLNIQKETQNEPAWQLYRMDYVINQDGEECTPEMCGLQGAQLLLSPEGKGVFLCDKGASFFQFNDYRQITPTDYTINASVYKGQDGIFCVDMPWAERACQPHFVPEELSIDTTALAGDWKMTIASDDEDVDELLAALLEMMDGQSPYTLHLNEGGSGCMESNFSLFGSNDAYEFYWIQANGRLYLFGEDLPFEEIQYEIRDDAFVAMKTTAWPELKEGISAPIIYDGKIQMGRWAGTWGFEYEEAGQSRIGIVELQMDGTMDVQIVPSWLNSDEVLESFQMRWRAADGGIEVWNEGEESIFCYGNEDRSSIRMAFWADEDKRMQRISGYRTLQESVPANVSLEDVLGVWRAKEIQVNEDLWEVQLYLKPDGSCEEIDVILPGGDPTAAYQAQSKGEWRFSEDGSTVVLCTSNQESPVARYADGALSLLIDDIQAPMTREAGMEAWHSGSYAVERLINYMHTGLVGVWEANFTIDPQDTSQVTLRIYASASGKAKVTYGGATSLGVWKPVSDGMEITLQQECQAIPGGNTFTVKRASYNSELFEVYTFSGTVLLEKVEDYWEADFSSAAEADFEVNNGVLARYRGTDTVIAIPENLGITEIGAQIFRQSDITRVVIPEGVTTIGEGAFEFCEQLSEAVFPSSLKQIGQGAFSGCTQLTLSELPAGLEKIGAYAFEKCSALTEIKVPFGVRELEDGVFSCCKGLRSVILPSGLQSIGWNTFLFCENLESISIPEGVTSIDRCAFADCYALTSVELPASIQDIHTAAFKDSEGVQAIVCPQSYAERYCVEEGLSHTTRPAEEWDFTIENGVLKTYRGSAEQVWISAGLGVSEIGEGAFAGQTQLKAVLIDKSVHTIGADAFEGCTGLLRVTLPETLEQIGADAFKDCGEATFYVRKGSAAYDYCVQNGIRFEIEDSAVDFIVVDGGLVEYLGVDAELVIPADLGIVYVGNKVFYENATVHSIVVPEGVTEIGSEAFSKCKALERVVLPESLKEISSNAFSGCSALAEINLPDGVTSIGESAFSGCSSIRALALPSNLSEIESGVFSGCAGLTELALPEGLEYIGEKAFASCIGLTELRFPSSMKRVDPYAFHGCIGLTQIHIEQGLEELGKSAFAGCSALKQAHIPMSVTEIGENVFAGCKDLTMVADANSIATTYARENGIPCECASADAQTAGESASASDFAYTASDGKITIEKYLGQDKSVRVPEQIDGLPVARIGDSAFAENEHLVQVFLPAGVVEISDMAFFDSPNLVRVTLPESVETFGRFVFGNCLQLELCVQPGSAAEAYAIGANLDYIYIE